MQDLPCPAARPTLVVGERRGLASAQVLSGDGNLSPSALLPAQAPAGMVAGRRRTKSSVQRLTLEPSHQRNRLLKGVSELKILSTIH